MAFDLSSIKRGKRLAPPRLVVYGPEGIGKSTFAAGAPNPVFFNMEDGLGTLDIAPIPKPANLEEFYEQIQSLIDQDHDYATAVIDTVDWLEGLVQKQVAADNSKNNIEELGYGKGYVIAADYMRDILQRLNDLRLKRGIAIVMTAHSQTKRFDDPLTEPYHRYSMKLHDKTQSLVMEWADAVGFANQRTLVKSEDVGFNKEVRRGLTAGGHMLFLNRTPAYDAKNRYGITKELPLDWAAFEQAIAA